MTTQFLTVPTLIRAMFRVAGGEDAPRMYKGSTASGASGAPGSGMRDELLASCRQGDLLPRFLAEMDRKLDAVLALMRRESLASEFPYEGHVVELSGGHGVLECAQGLEKGAYLELLLMLDEFPLRIISVIAEVERQRETRALTGPPAAVYTLRFVRMDAEEREAVIRFVFSEDRKRIRQQKSDEGI